MDGANIATRTGEGEAYVFHWEGVQKTLNNIAQRDLQHQKIIMDDYNKSSIKLREASSGIRPVDMPKATEYYNQFRTLAIALQDPKVRKNPELLAHFSQQRDEAYTQYVSHAERSKKVSTYDASLDEQRMKDKGINWVDPELYTGQKQLLRSMTVDALDKSNLMTPVPWTVLADDTPKDLENDIFGKQDKIEATKPRYNAAGELEGNEFEEFQGYVKPASLVAESSTRVLSQSNKIRNNAKLRYEQLAGAEGGQAQIQSLIQKATEIAKAEGGGDFVSIPPTYEGLYAAENILKSKIRVPSGTKGFKWDAEYVRRKAAGERMAEFKTKLNLQEGKERRMTLYKKANSPKGTSEDEQAYELDTDNLYDAAEAGDNDVVEEIGAEVTRHSGGKLVPVSRFNILDPTKNQKILEDFGLDIEPPQSYRPKPKPGESAQQAGQRARDEYVQKVLTAIKDKTGVKINGADISKGIVPVVVRQSTKANFDRNTNQYDGSSKVVVEAKAYSTKTKSKEQFATDFSNERIKIPKWKAEGETKKPNAVQRVVNTIKKKAKDYGL